MPPTAFFSYFTPYITMAATDPVAYGSPAEVDCIASGICSLATSLSSVRRLQIFGSDFGPQQSVSGDTVGRLIEYATSPSGPWLSSSVLYAPANWSHTLVEAFTLQGSGWIRVTLQLSDPYGTAFHVSSNAVSYADYSPTVSAIVGTPLASTTRPTGLPSPHARVKPLASPCAASP